MFFKQTLKSVENFHIEIVDFDKTDEDFQGFSTEAKKIKITFISVLKDQKKGDGNFSTWIENKELYIECIQETNFSF